MATSGAAGVLLAGCGDDSIAADTDSGTDGSSSGGSTTDGGPTSGSTSTDPDGTGSGTDSSGTDTGTGTGTDTGPADCAEPDVIELDPDAVAVDDATFPLAVMAGEMKPTSAMLAVHVSTAATHTLRVWQPGEAEGTINVVHEDEVTPNADGFVKVTVEGLCPGEWYRYAYFNSDDSSRSRIGQFRAAIADDALEPLTLAVSACNGSSFSWPALTHMANEGYDMFIHLGDLAYNDGAFTLPQYRASWEQYMAVEDMKNAMGEAGLYVTWDDHEIDNNSNFDRETMDPMQLEKRQNAMDSFFELLPIEGEGPDYRLWRSFRWGLTAEIIVLDCRYERRPSMGAYMSDAQMDFLKDRLLNSPCHFKIIMNSVPITNMPPQWDIALNDRWEGFPASRDDLMVFINANQIDNVWFLGGDFHVSFVSRLEPTGDNLWNRVREVAVSGGNVNPVPTALLGLNSDQFDYGINAARGCLVTLDPDANTFTVRFTDPATGDEVFSQTYTFGE